ncbi:MAG TPA: copper-binding protein, partial [Burkholderiales bacterium]|nr:copper-binding protein [Burkholderiales bacterium]
MKLITATVVASALLACAALPARTADMKDMSGMKDMPDMKMEANKKAEKQDHKGEGTVNSVDTKAGKVNLSHGPIQTLKWPAMTMEFAVKDKQRLAKLKPGQKVTF